MDVIFELRLMSRMSARRVALSNIVIEITTTKSVIKAQGDGWTDERYASGISKREQNS